ncbi:hypothetical protein L9F63_028285, partial [Diploptera punctata]
PYLDLYERYRQPLIFYVEKSYNDLKKNHEEESQVRVINFISAAVTLRIVQASLPFYKKIVVSENKCDVKYFYIEILDPKIVYTNAASIGGS